MHDGDALARRSGSVFAGYLCLPTVERPSPVAHHEHAVVIFYTGGEARFEQRQAMAVGAGDLLVIPAGEAHRMLAAHGVEGWALGVQPACLVGTGREWLLEPFARVRRGALGAARVAAERRPYLETLLRELGEVTARPGVQSEATSQALLTLVLGEVTRAQTDACPTTPSLVGEAMAYIEQHCTEGISLRDVAAAVRRSPAHLASATREATGRTVGDWITSGRMAEARRRLLHSDEPVEQIAGGVGYGDTTHFIRSFRTAHGQTPAAWRRQQRESAR